MADNKLDKFTEQAIRSFEGAAKASPEEAKAARAAAEQAAEVVRNDRIARDADLLEALKEAVAKKGVELHPMIRNMVTRADCSGAVCGVGCGVGCGAGCLIVGGATVGFGAAGGTTGGSGTSIALT
jgi:hypothetical protein